MWSVENRRNFERAWICVYTCRSAYWARSQINYAPTIFFLPYVCVLYVWTTPSRIAMIVDDRSFAQTRIWYCGVKQRVVNTICYVRISKSLIHVHSGSETIMNSAKHEHMFIHRMSNNTLQTCEYNWTSYICHNVCSSATHNVCSYLLSFEYITICACIVMLLEPHAARRTCNVCIWQVTSNGSTHLFATEPYFVVIDVFVLDPD